MQELITLFGDSTLLIKAILLIGTLRTIIKPIVTLVNNYVESSPSKSDNVKWEKVKASKMYKAFAFILDWTASIKLPKK